MKKLFEILFEILLILAIAFPLKAQTPTGTRGPSKNPGMKVTAIAYSGAAAAANCPSSTNGHCVIWTATQPTTNTFAGIGISWYISTTSGGEPITASSTSPCAAGATCTYEQDAVTPTLTYYGKAAACAGAACSAETAEVSATVPLLPSDLATPTGVSAAAH